MNGNPRVPASPSGRSDAPTVIGAGFAQILLPGKAKRPTIALSRRASGECRIRIFPDFRGSKKLLSARKGNSVWSTSTTPSSGSRWGSIIDRRSFCASNQAVLYAPYRQRQLGPVRCRVGLRAGLLTCHWSASP